VELDRKRISEALDKHLEKAVAAASPSTSRGSAGGVGCDNHRLVVPSSATSIPKGRCSEGDVAAVLSPRVTYRSVGLCRT
jgi:casein kinase II subunit beta